MALAVVVALLYTLLSALAALALGLRLPNLTWTNEITPIKQGGSVMGSRSLSTGFMPLRSAGCTFCAADI